MSTKGARFTPPVTFVARMMSGTMLLFAAWNMRPFPDERNQTKCRRSDVGSLKSLLVLLVFIVAVGQLANAQAPSIFFTDITSGPNSGGESVSGFAGAYVTIYGNNFGATQGSSTVTLNGASCLRVVSWGGSWLWYQKIVVQLGPSCASGNFSVTVNGQPSASPLVTVNGSATNPSTFTVRAGNIRCVSSSGSDSNSGSFGSCWKTIQHAITTIAAGDIAYIQTLTEPDSCTQYSAGNCILSAGSSGKPKAIVAYPGATPVISTGQTYGLRTPAVSGPGPYWVLAGLSISTSGSGDGEALGLEQPNFRLVANTIACTGGSSDSACAEFDSDGTSLAYQVYGNLVTQAGPSSFNNSSKTYHGFYFSGSDNHVDIGWNDIHNVIGGRGIQFYHTPDQYDIHIHDNLIHDTTLDGINLNGVVPDSGPVEVFNNVLYNVGKGPDPPDGAGVYSCINLQSDVSPSTPAKIYNNTCFNGGSTSTSNQSQSGGFSFYIPATVTNNLIYQTNGRPYFTSDAGCGDVKSGSNNDFFGNGGAPSCGGLTSSLNSNPQVVSTSTPDLHPQSGSPLVDAGVTVAGLTWDHDGVARPQGTAFDIGAYELPGTTVARPAPPTNLSVVVK